MLISLYISILIYFIIAFAFSIVLSGFPEELISIDYIDLLSLR
jgi:hypothetical protein